MSIHLSAFFFFFLPSVGPMCLALRMTKKPPTLLSTSVLTTYAEREKSVLLAGWDLTVRTKGLVLLTKARRSTDTMRSRLKDALDSIAAVAVAGLVPTRPSWRDP